MTVRGSCLCGDVAFAAEPPLELMAHCHCSMCRKRHGAAFSTSAGVDAARFRWLRGAELVERYKVPEAERFVQAFCRTCGSSMPNVDRERGRVVVSAGTLDDDPGAREGLHIFVASKADWYEIADDLPQYEAYPPGVYPPSPRG